MKFARTLYAELRQRYGASRVFVDTEDLGGGERWAAALDDALDAYALAADWTPDISSAYVEPYEYF